MESALIGRERECEALRQMLQREDTALVTVTGLGGMGKTRLARAVAQSWRERSARAVAVVALDGMRDPDLGAVIAQALGLQGQASQPEWERVKEHLRERRSLLVLDNFEHVLGAAPLVGELLRDAPQLKILVTSRVRLHLSAEQEFPLGPLELPRLPLQALSVDEVASVQLFVQRAQALQPQFVLDASNAEAVAAVCVRLDGWPLAIELAAARIKLMAPQQMLQRLQKRLGLLVGGPVDQPLRQRTLRGTLDWSHDLLGPTEQELFARLSVFNGGAELEAIEAVCTGVVPDVIETLHSLVNHSLLQQEGGRFVLLETIREYAAERLQALGQEAQLRMAHAQYFLGLAEQAQAQQDGARQRVWCDRLYAEMDNFRDAMAWCTSHQQVPMALRMACGLALPCMLRGSAAQARSWLESGLSHSPDGGDAARADAAARLGALCSRLGELVLARQHLEDACSRYRRLQDARGLARCLTDLASAILWHDGDAQLAENAAEEALEITRSLGDLAMEGQAAATLGTVLTHRGDLDGAREWLLRGMALSREAGDESHVTVALVNLGILDGDQGLVVRARRYTERALERSRAEGNVYGEVGCMTNLAEYMRRDGDAAAAMALLRGVLAKSQAMGDWRGAAIALDKLAEILLDRARPTMATKLLAAAALMRERHGIGVPRGTTHWVDDLSCQAQAQLGDQAFEAATREGRELSIVQLMALADTAPTKAQAPLEEGGAAALPAGLTSRELQVLRLVAAGLGDKQLAAQLGISPATASKHVANLLGKSMLPNRRALTLWAIAQGLVEREVNCRIAAALPIRVAPSGGRRSGPPHGTSSPPMNPASDQPIEQPIDVRLHV